MNLVRNQNQFVAGADFAQSQDLLIGKDPAKGVLRMGQEKDAVFGPDAFLKLIPVKGPAAVVTNMGDGLQGQPMVLVDVQERRVDRGAGDVALARLPESPPCQRQGGDETTKVHELILLDGDSVPLRVVGHDALLEPGLWLRVAEDAMIHPLPQGLDHRGGRREVHVGDPEGVELGTAVPLDGSRPAAGVDGVEIVRWQGS